MSQCIYFSDDVVHLNSFHPHDTWEIVSTSAAKGWLDSMHQPTWGTPSTRGKRQAAQGIHGARGRRRAKHGVHGARGKRQVMHDAHGVRGKRQAIQGTQGAMRKWQAIQGTTGNDQTTQGKYPVLNFTIRLQRKNTTRVEP